MKICLKRMKVETVRFLNLKKKFEPKNSMNPCRCAFIFANLIFCACHTNRPDVVRVAGKFDLLDRILPKLKRKGHR